MAGQVLLGPFSTRRTTPEYAVLLRSLCDSIMPRIPTEKRPVSGELVFPLAYGSYDIRVRVRDASTGDYTGDYTGDFLLFFLLFFFSLSFLPNFEWPSGLYAETEQDAPANTFL